jgi:hypothetical protein
MGIDGDRWWLFNRKKLTHNEGRTGGDLVVFWVCFMKREKKKKRKNHWWQEEACDCEGRESGEK